MIFIPKRKKQDGSTIRVRWTLLTMGVIFLTFSIFSYILLNTFQRVMIESEAEEMQELSEELVARFSKHYYPLEESSIASMLEEPEIELGPIPSPRYFVDQEEEFTPPVSLTKGGIIVKVYNNNEQLIYETDEEKFRFIPSSEQKIREISGPLGKALSLVEPVYSIYHDELLGYVHIIQTLESFHEMTLNIENSIIVIGIIALVFSSIIGTLLINTFMKPITDLTSAMEAIQENIESDVRLDEGSKNNEFSKLARTYNEMVDLIQRTMSSQKQFVEDVSHELRTPVAIVEGHLKMLDRWGKDDPEILEESISASLTETQRMKTLVQEMLDLSRVQEIEIYYKHEKTDITGLVNQLVSNFKLIYPDFIFNIDEDDDFKEDVYVMMYRNHLEQVLVNLLDNAVKYSLDRKEIHISISRNNGFVDVAIQDFGAGLSEEDQVKIFDRFYRVDKARSREKGGTGLGLPIVKELIEGYGGEVNVSSSLNQGSIFIVSIPFAEDEIE